MQRITGGIFLNGTVGAGKTTVAHCLGSALRKAGIPHAVIDLDAIRCAWPAPDGDRFNQALELQNLTSLVENYSRAGIRTIVMAGVIEDAAEIPRYRRALGGMPLTICRLTAPPAELRTRLVTRHEGDPKGLKWHVHRSAELNDILEEHTLEHFAVETTGRSPEVVAIEVLRLMGLVQTYGQQDAALRHP